MIIKEETKCAQCFSHTDGAYNETIVSTICELMPTTLCICLPTETAEVAENMPHDKLTIHICLPAQTLASLMQVSHVAKI